MNISRRKTIKRLSSGLAAGAILGSTSLLSCKDHKSSAVAITNSVTEQKLFFDISLGQWSLHKTFFGDSLKNGFGQFVHALQNDPDSLLQGVQDPLDFPTIAKNEYGINAVEYVNTFYYNKARNSAYLKELKDRCDSAGVESVLIMCDALGDLGDTDTTKRSQAIENHHQWVEAAAYLGCHAIRVNAAGTGTKEEVKDAAIQGLGALTEYGQTHGISIIVENHGSYSSDGSWLASVMEGVNSPYCGTLPDFGNFCITKSADNSECVEEYDRYKGMIELMPYAKGVSAKSHDFDAAGNEVHTDFKRMLQIVQDAGYAGYIDIEYEGSDLTESEGIKATKKLLEKVGAEIAG
jgi:sugar phosphate isomerase/epimerase